MLKFLKRTLAAFGLAAFSIGAAPAAPPPRAHPALWEVSDPDTTIYLFGTIHLLPANYQWETPAISQAITKSDKLYVETIVDPENPVGIRQAFAALGYQDGLPPLADRIPASQRAMLEAAIAQTPVPRANWDRMKTWAAAFLLLGVQFKEIGLAGENGPDTALREQFGAAGKSVGQLETNAQQLGYFNSLPESAQRALLEGALEPQNAASADFQKMLDAWAAGNVNGITRSFNEDLAASPPLMNTLLKQRNANWKTWIEQRLASPGTVMVAVGAGHLAGPDSVISLLQHDGYRVRRLQ